MPEALAIPLISGHLLLGLALCGLVLAEGLLAASRKRDLERSNQTFARWAWAPFLGTALLLVFFLSEAAENPLGRPDYAVPLAMTCALLTLLCWGCQSIGLYLGRRAPGAANLAFAAGYLSSVGVGLLPFVRGYLAST